MIKFLNKCKENLKGGDSFMVLKDNVAENYFILDIDDFSVTRTQ